ncbi:type I polyketide synthase [Mycolicibacterium litorale]|uniref:Phthiocerol synthesis polyketide synthase type I PpsA n=1 Tax=Mycolicibacterium litorale TaxID=758802 RepID=A0AAD1MQK6_9MYCO|nr:type I polyketide synthase [Mycolicibacterium litorale]MCV7413706.1 type I polyketide synthase [Mycolicibacterium litorale]TDY03412.1 6-methylsalicylic acid synthase [Mycolicibacterium litorale]BBY15209.1 phthiocerol synthesis polyketide synthase type I PpsA [Mycolicibacterium litorale]
MANTDSANQPAPEPVAIVGIGCRLAGDITTPADFWTFLLDGGSHVREVPAERWEPYLRRDPRNAAVLRETTPWGTFLDDLAGFDAEFFGVSPREAELMDPQQRLALEVSWEALEHAGVPPRSLAGGDTAVLMGVNSDDYGKLIMEDLPGIEAWTGIGTSLCGIANRVSHLLDLRGPSVALDAACAASLVAVHQACQLLRAGETSLALAGGVSALIGPGLTRVLDQAGATAPDGRCKSFDAAADGYGRGEGAAVVVLKRLADALRDGDRVIAVVRGGAVAQDGRTVGIMSPNGEAQADLFRHTCEISGIPPATVEFVEAHGTGTPTGDPVELNALAAVYGAGRAGGEACRVGSVKPNTGHLEGGAGVVGLIKAAMALQHEVIPPTAGVRALTPAVDWSTSGLRVPTEVEAWPRRDGSPRRAAVCSYGYGGTIAHVLLEEAPRHVASSAPDGSAPTVVPLSARSSARLAREATALAEYVRRQPVSLSEVAATLWTRRSHEPVRAAAVARDSDEFVAALDALADDRRTPSVVTGSVLPGAADGAVWVFSGHGSHWSGMGRELLDGEPAFAAVIDAVEPVFAAELGFSPRAALRTGELGGTDRVQALTFAMQVGLAAVLRERGVRPAAVIGHSVGEVAANVVAGVFDLTHGAAVACYRARGFRAVAGAGAMALVRLPFTEAERRLGDRADVVAAISASPESTVISGTVAAVEEMSARWADEGLMVRRVNTDVAFHSPAMDTLTAELARLTAELAPSRPAAVPLYSTALPDPRSTAPRDPDYWVANLRGRVRFAEAVTAAAEDGHRLFLEVSAHPVVAHSVAETLSHLGIRDHAVVPVLRREQPERPAVAAAVGSLYCHGAPVEPGVTAETPWATDLPGTQWMHRRHWRTPTAPPGGRGVHEPDTHTLLGGLMEVTGAVPARVWQTRLDFSTRPYPGDHPVQGTEIVPAAVLLNTFLTAAGTDLADVRLRTPVPPGRARDIQVVSQDRSLALASRLVDDDEAGAADQGAGWLTHCTALAAPGDDVVLTVLDEDEIRSRCTEALPPTFVVDTLATLGVAAMGFGWQVLELHRGDGELFARVAADADGSTPATWAGLLDAATSAASTIFDGPPRLRMPARIEHVHVHDKPPAVALLHVRRRSAGTVTDVVLAEESGAISVSLTGMAFEELENPSGRDTVRLLHHVAWHPVDWPDTAPPSDVTVVGGDEATVAFVTRDLAEAGVAHRTVPNATELGDLTAGSVVLLLPRTDEAPQACAEFVLRTLQHLDASARRARLWVLTSEVHEGINPAHAPLWGMARVAAAEHPQLWGGVLDVAGDRLPVRALSALAGHGVVVVRDGVAYAARLAHAGAGEAAPMQCSPGGTYLITGGTGVLGLRLAQRLADLGARRLVLVSRSGIPDRSDWPAHADREAVAVVSALEQRGVSVRVAAVDVGAPGAVTALRSALADLPPVRGVIHAAGVEAGALLANTTPEDIGAAMRPKVDGMAALHELFAPGELDWMVLFSSCGYLAGFPGQGAYACGNAYLDAFARHRRRLGDRTTSVAWTAWRGMGMGSASGFVAAQLDALGMGTVGVDDAMRALDSALRDDDANVVVLPVLPAAAAVPILADVAPTSEEDAAVGPVVEDRGDMDVAEWSAQQVLTAVAAELGCATEDVDPRLPLVEIGVDSIMTVALRRQLEKQTGLTLPPTLLWEYPTAAAVSERIAELLIAEDDSAA